MKSETALRILWVCAAINAVAAIIAWGSEIGGVNLGIAVATAFMAMRGRNRSRKRKTGK